MSAERLFARSMVITMLFVAIGAATIGALLVQP